MKHIYSVLLTFFIGIQLNAQQDLSLAEAINTALQNNYSIQILQKTEEISKNNNNYGTAGLFPTITAGGLASYRYDDLQGNSTTLNPSVSMNMNLFRGFTMHITKDRLEYLEKLSGGNTAIVIENTLQAVILNYYRALLEKERLGIVEKVMKLSRDRYNYMMERKELGSAITFDVLQAKNSYLADSSDFISQKLNYDNTIRSLNLLLGVKESIAYNLTDEFNSDMQEFVFDELLTALLSNNKTIQNQYLNIQLSESDIRLKKASLYPSLSLSAAYNMLNINSENQAGVQTTTDNYNYYVNFSLSYVLSNGGNVRRSIQNAQVNMQIDQIELEEMKHKLTNQLFSSYQFYEVRKQLLGVAIESEKTAALNLQIAEDKFKNGSINSFNYRDVQLLYLNTAFSKLSAIFNLIDSQTELYRLSGSIINQN